MEKEKELKITEKRRVFTNKELDIYEIIEENKKFYIVANNNNEILLKIDRLI